MAFWNRDNDLGPTKKTRQEWKGRSDADRIAGANEGYSGEYSASGFGQESCVTNDYETWKRETDNAEAKRRQDAEKQYKRIKKRIQRGESPFSDDVLEWLHSMGYTYNPFVGDVTNANDPRWEPQYKVQGSGWFSRKNEYENFAQEFIDRYPPDTDPNKMWRDANKEYHWDARPDLDNHDREWNNEVLLVIKRTLGK